jgi:Ni/Fe-hydrogenase 1 B-type cytochrome subunit
LIATLNLWLDVITGVLFILVTVGFIIPHFIGSVLTGRVRRHFKENYWDPLAHRMHDPNNYHYRQPLGNDFPIPTRVWHWVNIVTFVVLAISGTYIRYPWFYGGREVMRYIHYTMMWIITANLLWRLVYLALVDWRNYFIFDLDDLRMAPSIIKYYTFIGPPYEHRKKFNPLQRPTYPLLWLLIGLQAISGFIIFRPTIAPAFVANLAGGPAALAAWMRFFHSANMRLMILIAVFHSYLGIMEDYPVLKLFWFFQEPDLSKYEHEEHHGAKEEPHQGKSSSSGTEQLAHD